MSQILKHQLSWKNIEDACAQLYQNLRNDHNTKPFDCIIGLTRGGLIPGVILSELLDIPLIPITYSSQNGNGVTKDRWSEPLVPLKHGTNLRIILCDDIVDTGNTMAEVVKYYGSQQHDIVTATIVHKPNDNIIPDHGYITTDKGDPLWYVFPWEV